MDLMSQFKRESIPITRRKFLLHLSALSRVLAMFAFRGRVFDGLAVQQTAPPAATIAPTALACIASPSMTEGPYFVDEMLKRADIRTDPTDNSVKPGIPLKLAIGVFSVSGSVGAPLKGTQIDIWHWGAPGLHSSESTNNTLANAF